jgi:hypothetical protein
MYLKALTCVIGSGLPGRRQKQLKRVKTGHLIERELPNKRMHADAIGSHDDRDIFNNQTSHAASAFV